MEGSTYVRKRHSGGDKTYSKDCINREWRPVGGFSKLSSSTTKACIFTIFFLSILDRGYSSCERDWREEETGNSDFYTEETKVGLSVSSIIESEERTTIL